MQGGGGSPEQSQRVVFGRQLDENYSQTSARQAKPRFRLQARALEFSAKGGKPAEPVPYLVPSDWTMKNLSEKAESVADRVAIHRRSSRFHNRLVGSRFAFTMAEILLSLTIIGVVAAITLPSLTGNINERSWNTQRKALYARFSQAIALMPALNGYGTLTEDESGNVIEDTAAETFVTAGLAKVLKINNICDSEHLDDCGIPDKIAAINGSIAFSLLPGTLVEYNSMFNGRESNNGYCYSQMNTKAVAFETANGESIAVYYNPFCMPYAERAESAYFIQPYICANFIYDLNGTKGPNTMGKDIGFITAFYATDSKVVAPMPLQNDLANGNSYSNLQKACKQMDNESRMPNIDELASIFCNRTLSGVKLSAYGSGTLLQDRTANGAWGLGIRMNTGHRLKIRDWDGISFRCIER